MVGCISIYYTLKISYTHAHTQITHYYTKFRFIFRPIHFKIFTFLSLDQQQYIYIYSFNTSHLVPRDQHYEEKNILVKKRKSWRKKTIYSVSWLKTDIIEIKKKKQLWGKDATLSPFIKSFNIFLLFSL